MWKNFSFGIGGIQCLFILRDEKNVIKSIAVSKMSFTFAAELEQTKKNGCVEGSNG